MSTAVVICGQARTFAKCWPTQYWYVYSRLVDPTFYVVVEDDQQAPDMARIFERFPKERVNVKLLPTHARSESPCPPLTNEAFAPYPVMTPAWSIMKCFWNYREAWRFLVDTEAENGSSADLIVRTRPDAYFHEGFLPKRPVEAADFVSLWWERYGGVNDRIVFMGRAAARVHMTMIDRVDEILGAGCPLHGESFVGGALRLGGVNVRHELDFWLSLHKLDGRVDRPNRNPDDVPPPR